MDNYMYLVLPLLNCSLYKLRSLRGHRLNQVRFLVRLILRRAPSWLRYWVANRVHVFTQKFRRTHFTVFGLLRSMVPGSGIGGFHTLILAFVLRHVLIVLARVLIEHRIPPPSTLDALFIRSKGLDWDPYQKMFVVIW
jgi:hypothetical protein